MRFLNKFLDFYLYIKEYFTHNTPVKLKKKSTLLEQEKWYKISFMYKINIKGQMVIDEFEIREDKTNKIVIKPKLKIKTK